MGDLILRPDPDPTTSLEALVDTMTHRRFAGEHGGPGGELAPAREAARAWAGRVAARLGRLEVLVDGAPGGHVWQLDQGEDVQVVALSLDDHTVAGAVREELVRLAREQGHRRLTVAVSPGDPVQEALVGGGGFVVAAIQMRLDLAHDLPAEDVVALTPMSTGDWEAWEADEVESYAAERVRAGESRGTALRISREQHATLLPDGRETEHHHFFTGHVTREGERVTVGSLWIGTERPMAFVYDVGVPEGLRRRGYGAGLMRAGALWAQRRGAHALGLNVFGHNHGAKELYDRLGFHVVEQLVGREP